MHSFAGFRWIVVEDNALYSNADYGNRTAFPMNMLVDFIGRPNSLNALKLEN